MTYKDVYIDCDFLFQNNLVKYNFGHHTNNQTDIPDAPAAASINIKNGQALNIVSARFWVLVFCGTRRFNSFRLDLCVDQFSLIFNNSYFSTMQ